MKTRIFVISVAALILETVSLQADAAVRADCRYWLMDVHTSPTATRHGPWTNPTGFALILATTQRDILADASRADRNAAKDDYVQAIEKMLHRTVRR